MRCVCMTAGAVLAAAEVAAAVASAVGAAAAASLAVAAKAAAAAVAAVAAGVAAGLAAAASPAAAAAAAAVGTGAAEAGIDAVVVGAGTGAEILGDTQGHDLDHHLGTGTGATETEATTGTEATIGGCWHNLQTAEESPLVRSFHNCLLAAHDTHCHMRSHSCLSVWHTHDGTRCACLRRACAHVRVLAAGHVRDFAHVLCRRRHDMYDRRPPPPPRFQQRAPYGGGYGRGGHPGPRGGYRGPPPPFRPRYYPDHVRDRDRGRDFDRGRDRSPGPDRGYNDRDADRGGRDPRGNRGAARSSRSPADRDRGRGEPERERGRARSPSQEDKGRGKGDDRSRSRSGSPGPARDARPESGFDRDGPSGGGDRGR